ncbi:MAG: hypothetical protein HYV63_30255 [Candidatus Schekmanbacteria bacterium]|nr:hypothetical protein [Candidatus Schekmanbacteria bacterium]
MLVGDDRFAVELPLAGDQPGATTPMYALQFFNEEGGRLIQYTPVRRRQARRPGGGPISGGWAFSPEHPGLSGGARGGRLFYATPLAFARAPAKACRKLRAEVDWNGDGRVDLRMSCEEYRRLRTGGDGGIPYLYEGVGFHAPTFATYDGKRLIHAAHALVRVDDPDIRRNARGAMTP